MMLWDEVSMKMMLWDEVSMMMMLWDKVSMMMIMMIYIVRGNVTCTGYHYSVHPM